ncbi:adenylate/guanylate cyclase domain-containing protein [Desulfonatronovibrio hydrogenovorans]|uniref:adenylate/guanylate cyclase domain-containing protein n=1 Tax=Desulfonatronovibrio hydrogenovorans TaxID=53245 RepID=UPI0006899825|nr:adenylate/guanylate cyclase domain-containing protein [Desulfonatronovibrio hydrogenovorans]
MKLSLRIFILMFAVAFTISGATGSYFYIQSRQAMLEAVQEQLLTAAKAFSGTIAGDDLEILTHPEHMDYPEYLKIQRILHHITQTNQDFLFAYTMRLQDGEVVFVVDSPPSDDTGDGTISEAEMPEPIGAVYAHPPSSLLQGFVRPATDDHPHQDQWGWTISGYAPIKNSQGRNVGLLGIDMCADRFDEKLSAIRRAGFLSLGMAALMAGSFTWLLTRTVTRPVKSLQQGFDRVARGDLETSLEPRGNDELAQLTRQFNQMVRELREKQILKTSLGKMLPKEAVSSILSNNLRLGGETVRVTILFCDLRRFTAMSEKLPPKIIVSLLNDYFTAMVEVVEKHSGIVDKFIGDKIMAVFGHPSSSGRDQLNALNAGLEMINRCDELNSKLGLGDNLRLENSIGIHTGQVLAGNIGSPERMEYTIMGDAVNTAARLEAKTRAMNTRLAVSQETAGQIESLPANLEFSGDQSLEGRTGKLGVYVLKR